MAKKITINDLAIMMKEGFDELHEKFVSKDDLKETLKNFATKEDLKRFATKEDLKGFATKEDLKRFATKEELDEKFNKTLENEDYIIRTLIQVRDELAASNGARLRHQDRIDNHEIRIAKLEKAK